MNGSFTAGNINNQAQVDGTTNPSLAAAVGSSQCFNSPNTTSNGCVIWDGFNEAPFQAWPFLGDHNYRLNIGHGGPPGGPGGDGVWWTKVPVVLANDQIVGSGRVKSVTDGSTGTIIKACDGGPIGSACRDLYFPNAPPVPVTPTLSSSGSGSLTGTYYVQFVWVVNLATGPDSKITTSWGVYPSSGTPIYAGYAVSDNPSGNHCSSNPSCTWMALNAGSATSAPSWTGGIGQTLKDGSGGSGNITWINVGNYNTSTSYPYGTPGLSLAGDRYKSNSLSSQSLTFNAPNTVGAYPTCTNTSVQYNNGTYVLSPNGQHTFRAVGSGTASSCSSLNNPSSQGIQIHDNNNLYWQEVGPPSTYILPVGYLVVVSKDPNDPRNVPFAGTVQDTSGCSPRVQVGTLIACDLSATYTLSAYSTTRRPSPMIDTTHPLIVLGEQQENPANDSNATFMTRAQDLTADANNIAGEACLYVYAQEQSGCYAVNAISGTDASIAAIGPGSQNAMIWDFVAGNPATGNYQQQSVAGVFLDARDGSAMKTVAHGTITPYNNPTASAVKYGLQFVGKTDITIESVHTENVQDGIFCEGDPNNASSYAGCWILSTDPSTTVTNSTVHLGTQVATAFVNTVTASQVGSPYALQDDTNAPA